MLPRIVDQNAEQHFFIRDTSRGFHLLFTSRAEYANKPFRPHWVREAADEATFQAMARWASVRRDQWQAWGELAERIGRDAFWDHMERLMDAEPPEQVIAHVVLARDDPAELGFGEVLHGPNGVRKEVVHMHRFASEKARRAFLAWFNTDGNLERVEKLINVAYSAGTAAMGAVLDDLAAQGTARTPRSGRRPSKRPAEHRRGRRGAAAA